MRYLPDLFDEEMNDEMDAFDWLTNSFDKAQQAATKAFNKAMSPLYGHHEKNLMKTDVTQKDGNYEVAVDLPGFKKDEVTVDLKDGYLTVSTNKDLNKEEKDEKGNVIRQERYAGNMSRSFYVGDDIKEEDVKAKFEDGVLKITIPDKEAQKAVEEKKHIAIE